MYSEALELLQGMPQAKTELSVLHSNRSGARLMVRRSRLMKFGGLGPQMMLVEEWRSRLMVGCQALASG